MARRKSWRPADLERPDKYMLEIEGVDAISDEMRAVVEKRVARTGAQAATEEATRLIDHE
jgi:hypothetical protein